MGALKTGWLGKWASGLLGAGDHLPSSSAVLNHVATRNRLDLAARVLECDDYIMDLRPDDLLRRISSPILVLAPHQDDESIGAGGTLIRARDLGVKTHVLFLTDGGIKEKSNSVSKFGSVEAYAETRRSEAAEVCRRLGAEMHELGISNARPNPTTDDLDDLASLIHEISPKIVMLPWLLDGAPKHRMVNHLIWLCCQRHALPPFEVWSYQVNNTFMPSGYVDITDVIEEKRNLIAVYKSQNSLTRPYDHQTIGLNAWNARYIPNKAAAEKEFYLEVFITHPLVDHLQLIERTYFQDLDALYESRKGIVRAMENLHRNVCGSV